MKSNNTAIPGTGRSRRALIAIVTAGIMSAVGVGSYAGWTATADVRPAVFDDASSQLTINIDSLYTAITAEETEHDSSYIAELEPERTIAGRVSWYGPGFHGRRTANGERFDRNEMTAAHKSLPFGSLVRVVDVSTGKGVLVRINDRGPFCRSRVLDLSEEAAERLGIRGRGTATARIELYTKPMPRSTATADEDNTSLTFDLSGRAIAPHGFAVEIARTADFDDAIELQHLLQKQGQENVYLTQVAEEKGRMAYKVTIGLFSSERLCKSLLSELGDRFKTASMIRFDDGTPVSPGILATVDVEDPTL